MAELPSKMGQYLPVTSTIDEPLTVRSMQVWADLDAVSEIPTWKSPKIIWPYYRPQIIGLLSGLIIRTPIYRSSHLGASKTQGAREINPKIVGLLSGHPQEGSPNSRKQPDLTERRSSKSTSQALHASSYFSIASASRPLLAYLRMRHASDYHEFLYVLIMKPYMGVSNNRGP